MLSRARENFVGFIGMQRSRVESLNAHARIRVYAQPGYYRIIVMIQSRANHRRRGDSREKGERERDSPALLIISFVCARARRGDWKFFCARAACFWRRCRRRRRWKKIDSFDRGENEFFIKFCDGRESRACITSGWITYTNFETLR